VGVIKTAREVFFGKVHREIKKKFLIYCAQTVVNIPPGNAKVYAGSYKRES
jgi:hypothetical protein